MWQVGWPRAVGHASSIVQKGRHESAVGVEGSTGQRQATILLFDLCGQRFNKAYWASMWPVCALLAVVNSVP